MSAEASVVQVEGLAVRRGRFQLEVPAWRVPPGCVVGVVGPNGAGKTTLLETLCGFRQPDAGTVRILGVDPLIQPDVRTRVGFMAAEMPVWNLRIDRLLRRLSGS